MQAIVFETEIARGALRRVERPDPEPGPRDVVLRMRAAALNYRDLAIMSGEYHVDVTPPLVPLSDGAGEVVAVGDEVTRLRPGDLACPAYLPDWIDGPLRAEKVRRRLGGPDDGVLAELVRRPEDELVRAPAHLDPAEAATLPTAGVTAWHCLFAHDRLTPDETLLVQGGGGVATAALALGRGAGARVVAVTGREEVGDRLRALGADVVVTSGRTPGWPAEVIERTGGADVAVNVAGGATLTPTVQATTLGGRVHLVGYAAERAATLDVFAAIRHATTIRTATAGSRADFESLVAAVERHGIRPPIERSFPVDRLDDAVAHLGRGGHVGKVVLDLTW